MRSTGAIPAAIDGRSINRDEVQHRARAIGPGAASLALLVVNISEDGLMARCEAVLQPGDVISIDLPDIGRMDAQIRWALGGRIGCQFEQRIAPDAYGTMLTAMRAR